MEISNGGTIPLSRYAIKLLGIAQKLEHRAHIEFKLTIRKKIPDQANGKQYSYVGTAGIFR